MVTGNTKFETIRLGQLKRAVQNDPNVILVDTSLISTRKLSEVVEQFLADTKRIIALIRVDGFMWSLMIANVQDGVFQSTFCNSFGVYENRTVFSALTWIQDRLRARKEDLRFGKPVLDESLEYPVRSIGSLIPVIFSKICQYELPEQPEEIPPGDDVVIHQFSLLVEVDPTAITKLDFLNEWMQNGLLTEEDVETWSQADANSGIVLFSPYVRAIALLRISVVQDDFQVLFVKSDPYHREGGVLIAIEDYLSHERGDNDHAFRDIFHETKYDPLFLVQSDAWTDPNALELFMINFGVPKQVRLRVLHIVRFFIVKTHLLTGGASSPSTIKNKAVAVYYSATRGDTGQMHTHILYFSVPRGFDGDRNHGTQRLLSLVLRERPIAIYHGRLSSTVIASGIKRLSFDRDAKVYGWDLTDPEQFAWLEANTAELQKTRGHRKPTYYCEKSPLTAAQRLERGFLEEEATTENCMQQGFGGGLRHMKKYAI